MQITKHFNSKELNCSCCAQAKVNHAFIEKLEEARVNAGIPFVITSGYRCSNKQKSLKEKGYETASGISPHQKGVAVDIFANDPQRRYKILMALSEVGFNRFGIAHNFIHVDMDAERIADRMWYYK